MVNSIEYFGIDERTSSKKLGCKETERCTFLKSRVGIVKKLKAFTRQIYEKRHSTVD